MLISQLCVAIYANLAWLFATYIRFVHSFNFERNTTMNQFSITQTLLTCAGILSLLGSVAYYGAINNI